jgi:hypothetical protein
MEKIVWGSLDPTTPQDQNENDDEDDDDEE